MTPLEVATVSVYLYESTPPTLFRIRAADRLWRAARGGDGPVDLDAYRAEVEEAEALQDLKDRAFDREWGTEDKDVTLPADDATMCEDMGYDKKAWAKFEKSLPCNLTEMELEGEQRWERWERLKTTDANRDYVIPDEEAELYYPGVRDYPDHVPMHARAWATYTSGDWLHPNFDGEIIRDHEQNTNFPQKHDWDRNPDHPDGLWEWFDPNLTVGLTPEERRRAANLSALREKNEEYMFSRQDFQGVRRACAARLRGDYPRTNTERARGLGPGGDQDSGDPFRALPEPGKRPWQCMDELERARAGAALQRREWELLARPCASRRPDGIVLDFDGPGVPWPPPPGQPGYEAYLASLAHGRRTGRNLSVGDPIEPRFPTKKGIMVSASTSGSDSRNGGFGHHRDWRRQGWTAGLPPPPAPSADTSDPLTTNDWKDVTTTSGDIAKHSSDRKRGIVSRERVQMPPSCSSDLEESEDPTD